MVGLGGGSGRGDRASPVQSSLPLRGRNEILTSVGSHLDRLLSGAGTVLVIEGRAGMGKSRLLDEIAAISTRLSMRVGRGAADPGASIVPLAPLLEALSSGDNPILAADSLRSAHGSPEPSYWFLQDLEASLEQAALAGPMLICLDDLQWADSATAAALRALPVRLTTVPVGWVLATRPGPTPIEVRNAIDRLTRSGAEKIDLGPLDKTAVAQVAADVLAAEPGILLLDMAEWTGGSPFLLCELLHGLNEEALVEVRDGRAEVVEVRVPDRVCASMQQRLERTSESARQVAVVAASLGRRFSLDGVAAMLGVLPASLLQPVEDLLRDSILIERNNALAFFHDLTYEGVRSSVPVPVRRSLDRQAATVLLERGALPVEVALQLAASAEPGDDIAITTLLRAAEVLSATDPSGAADLSRQALALAPANHPVRGPLVAGAAVWLHAAGRTDEAMAFADTALRQVLRPTEEAEVRLSIASMFSVSPEIRADSCRAALALQGLPAALRNRHLALLVHNLSVGGRVPESRELVEQARGSIDDSGDVRTRFMLELAESGIFYAEGRFASALSLVEKAVISGELAGDDLTRLMLARQWRCDILMMNDRLDQCLDLSAENIGLAQKHLQAWALRVFETGRARTLLQLGRLADAYMILKEQVTEDSAPKITNILDAAAVTALAHIAIHTGDEGSRRVVGQIAQVMLGEHARSVCCHGVWILALDALAKGNFHGAHSWLCQLGESERFSILPLYPADMTDEPRLVHLALAVEDLDLAVCVNHRSEERAAFNPEVPSLAAAAAHTRGLLCRERADLASAADLFTVAHRPLAAAAAFEDLGVQAIEDGDTAGAIAAFNRSLSLFADVSATWDAARLRGRLRSLGVRRRLVPSPRQTHGWASLTDSEVAVARLVAQGLSNRDVSSRLFISYHTVSGHLRNVFTKLGINSRVELVRIVDDHE
jgi:DNA-binding CsgD family transcriptional regulator/tetratricopeptide (TPR) repeat protein